MDYLYYILAVLVVGLISTCAVRLATRSQNPDLLLQYEARKRAAKAVMAEQSAKPVIDANGKTVLAVKSLRQRHVEKSHCLTPWGWPGSDRETSRQLGISDSVRNFTDRLVRDKQVIEEGSPARSESIRALLEDRYAPVDRGMTEVPYHKVKRPLLRDPTEMHDQLDNLGSAEPRQLRNKLQFLSAMNQMEESGSQTNGQSKGGKGKKVEFRYVELKDLKQPWGW